MPPHIWKNFNSWKSTKALKIQLFVVMRLLVFLKTKEESWQSWWPLFSFPLFDLNREGTAAVVQHMSVCLTATKLKHIWTQTCVFVVVVDSLLIMNSLGCLTLTVQREGSLSACAQLGNILVSAVKEKYSVLVVYILRHFQNSVFVHVPESHHVYQMP